MLHGIKISSICIGTVCPAGSFLNFDNSMACEMCPVHKYSPDMNANSCTDCPSGTVTQGQTGQTSRANCGEFSTQENSKQLWEMTLFRMGGLSVQLIPSYVIRLNSIAKF